MSLSVVVLFGIALAMDALGVTLGIGLNNKIKLKEKLMYILSFAFFQFLFTFLGGSLGNFFTSKFIALSNVIGGLIIIGVGLYMIFSGEKKENEDDSKLIIGKKSALLLGISVSIDALVVGFTAFNSFGMFHLTFYSFIIGTVTLLICYIGFILSDKVKKLSIVESYSNYISGIILIIIGIKIILSL
ncbi:manganese efflux pump [Clostridium sp. LY3-2]|uniref:manganese efflux pump MntP n=1 Tax=Clostridium TaxID=1485 RepID=UPI0018837C1D|nr:MULTISPECIES: manganese efflux pump [Clostridium]MCR6513628.1 manganese efflux pump [Clostridium sp. LY3-2]